MKDYITQNNDGTRTVFRNGRYAGKIGRTVQPLEEKTKLPTRKRESGSVEVPTSSFSDVYENYINIEREQKNNTSFADNFIKKSPEDVLVELLEERFGVGSYGTYFRYEYNIPSATKRDVEVFIERLYTQGVPFRQLPAEDKINLLIKFSSTVALLIKERGSLYSFFAGGIDFCYRDIENHYCGSSADWGVHSEKFFNAKIAIDRSRDESRKTQQVDRGSMNLLLTIKNVIESGDISLEAGLEMLDEMVDCCVVTGPAGHLLKPEQKSARRTLLERAFLYHIEKMSPGKNFWEWFNDNTPQVFGDEQKNLNTANAQEEVTQLRYLLEKTCTFFGANVVMFRMLRIDEQFKVLTREDIWNLYLNQKWGNHLDGMLETHHLFDPSWRVAKNLTQQSPVGL